MTTRKPRLLLVNEYSPLSTGYSTYGHELMKRLAASGKYELAELACYYDREASHPDLPWAVYPNTPADAEGRTRYDANPINQFGLFGFNATCLEFRPDVVFSFRDAWMDEFIGHSPFRRHFRWAEMPTVDAVPQHDAWLSSYMTADAVLCYTDWGADVLRREGGGLIDVRGSAPPGVDLDVFRPMDRAAVRSHFRMDEDPFIIGMVARNQPRKLFPNLIDAFRLFLRRAPSDLAARTYLYLHTSYPDGGWDIPDLIKQGGVSHKVLLTYVCRACSAAFPYFFQDVRGHCLRCHRREAILPNVRHGVDRPTLALINNVFDVSVQYATNEGFGIPMIEAAACGVPVFATDYSAMSDVVRKLGGCPIRVAHLQADHLLGTLRAIPDDGDLVTKLIYHFTRSEESRSARSRRARAGVEEHYTWGATAARWMEVFDSFELRPHAETWCSPPRLLTPGPTPAGLERPADLARWAISAYLGRPDLATGHMAMKYARDLGWGFRLRDDGVGKDKHAIGDFSAADMLEELGKINANFNEWEGRRATLAGTG